MTDEKENKPTGVEVEGQGDPALDPNTGATEGLEKDQAASAAGDRANDQNDSAGDVDEAAAIAAEEKERAIYEKWGRAPMRLEAMEQALIRSGKLHPNYFEG